MSITGASDAAVQQPLCDDVREALTSAGFESDGCARWDGPPGDAARRDARGSGRYALHVALEGQHPGALRLHLERWLREEPGSTAALLWNIPAAPPEEQRTQVRRRLRDFLALLPPPPAEAARLGLDPERYAARATRLPQGPELIESLRRDAVAPPPNVGGTLLDIGVLLSFATIQYQLDPSTNSQDWKLDYSLQTLEQKISFQELDFDDNAFRLNSGHAMSGSYYFLSARERNLSVWDSFLAASVAAFTWELLPEFREVTSINDMLMTPLGGLAIGEALFQLSTFFRRSDDTLVNQLIADVLGGPARLIWNRDHSVPGNVRLLDERGYTVESWHRIRLFAGADTMTARNPLSLSGGVGGAFGLDATLLHRADYDHPGERSAFSDGTLFTRLRARLSYGEQGLRELRVQARSDYTGYYGQLIGARPDGLWGLAGYVALGAVLEHDERLVQPSTDAMTAVGPVGASVHLALLVGGLRLRGSAELHPVFAQIRSEGLQQFRAAGGTLDGAPAVLREHGYYFALGLRPSYQLSAELLGFEAGVEHRRYDFESFQSVFLAGSHPGPFLVDERLSWAVWLAKDLPVRHTRVVLWVEQSRRSGQADGATQTQDDSHVLLRLDWSI